MNRQQLAHILRAAADVAGDPDIVVFGSQSILGSYDEDDLPRPATASMEADIGFIEDVDRRKADSVEGSMGEMSSFHNTYGIYAEGIHIDTVTLPDGWQERTLHWNLQSSHPANAHFLEPHDLAISKLAAYRTKDLDFVRALITSGLLNPATLRERIKQLPPTVDQRVIHRINSWVESMASMNSQPPQMPLVPPSPGGEDGTTSKTVMEKLSAIVDALLRERPVNPNRRTWGSCNAYTLDGGRCRNLKGSCPHH